MAFYSRRFKNNDYNDAITMPNKENNRTMCSQIKTFSYTWMLKIKEKMEKIDLKLLPKIQWILLYIGKYYNST